MANETRRMDTLASIRTIQFPGLYHGNGSFLQIEVSELVGETQSLRGFRYRSSWAIMDGV